MASMIFCKQHKYGLMPALFQNNTMRSLIETKATLFLRQNFTFAYVIHLLEYAPHFNASEVLLSFLPLIRFTIVVGLISIKIKKKIHPPL